MSQRFVFPEHIIKTNFFFVLAYLARKIINSDQLYDADMDRKVEVATAAILVLFLLPFFLVACIAVRISIGSPIFFVQTRVGRNKRPIRVHKLRTMHHQPVGQTPLPDDARTTATTVILRRLRLDELPQLLAVLRGDLALVGPRPLLPETIESFGAEGKIRCAVRPGITGWSQVSGNTHLSDEEKLQLDLWYVANRSMALDFRILFETGLVALFGERRKPSRLLAAQSDIAMDTPAGRPSL
ncbi:MAG: sugar transferase [Pseudomonadota bacterium]